MKQSISSSFTALCDGLVLSVGGVILIINAAGMEKSSSVMHYSVNISNVFSVSFFQSQPLPLIFKSTSVRQLLYLYEFFLFPLTFLWVQSTMSIDVFIAFGAISIMVTRSMEPRLMKSIGLYV